MEKERDKEQRERGRMREMERDHSELALCIWRYREGEKGKRSIKRKKQKQREREREKPKEMQYKEIQNWEGKRDRQTDRQPNGQSFVLWISISEISLVLCLQFFMNKNTYPINQFQGYSKLWI